MKLKELNGILRSTTGGVQQCVVWDSRRCEDLAFGCSVEYAIKTYGGMTLDRIYTYETELVLSVH